MIISILNCDKKFGIGKKNGLLFSLPKDMKFFRETTKGHVVCMGENTLLSFPESKPLKNRTNIVLSQDSTHNYEGVINVHTFEDFLKEMKKQAERRTKCGHNATIEFDFNGLHLPVPPCFYPTRQGA